MEPPFGQSPPPPGRNRPGRPFPPSQDLEQLSGCQREKDPRHRRQVAAPQAGHIGRTRHQQIVQESNAHEIPERTTSKLVELPGISTARTTTRLSPKSRAPAPASDGQQDELGRHDRSGGVGSASSSLAVRSENSRPKTHAVKKANRIPTRCPSSSSRNRNGPGGGAPRQAGFGADQPISFARSGFLRMSINMPSTSAGERPRRRNPDHLGSKRLRASAHNAAKKAFMIFPRQSQKYASRSSCSTTSLMGGAPARTSSAATSSGVSSARASVMNNPPFSALTEYPAPSSAEYATADWRASTIRRREAERFHLRRLELLR